MKLKKSVNGNMVEWCYGSLVIYGVLGRMGCELSDFAEKYEGKRFEFGSVRDEGHRDFLAGFHHNPTVDVTIAQSSRTSIVTVSLDQEGSKEALDHLIEALEFKAGIPYANFILDMNSSLGIEMIGYNRCSELAKTLEIPFEKLFEVVRYANFLKRCVGSGDGALSEAAERYGCQKLVELLEKK